MTSLEWNAEKNRYNSLNLMIQFQFKSEHTCPPWWHASLLQRYKQVLPSRGDGAAAAKATGGDRRRQKVPRQRQTAASGVTVTQDGTARHGAARHGAAQCGGGGFDDFSALHQAPHREEVSEWPLRLVGKICISNRPAFDMMECMQL